MIRNLLLALAASLLPCAAAAQTVTSPTLIPGTSPAAPKSLKLVGYASKVEPKVKKNTPVFGPCNDAAPFAYSLTASCPAAPVVVPVVTPQPADGQEIVRVATAKGTDTFAHAGGVFVGIAHDGHLGAYASAPAGWPTLPNYKRLALWSTARKIDPSITDANVEGFVITFRRNGRLVRLSNLVGRLELDNAQVAADGTWSAEAQGLRVEQRPTVIADGVRLTVTLTNTGATPITDVRYLREADFTDYNRVFETTNRIVAAGSIEADLLGRTKGATAYLRTTDPRFVASVFGFINEDTEAADLTSQAVGYTVIGSPSLHVGNLTANLLGRLGPLELDASTSFALETGVR